MPSLRNIRLLLEYNGSRYHGWQRQRQEATIQGVVEEALAKLTGARLTLIGSGRTDAGVHARGQVANFHTTSAIPLKAFNAGLNSLLPDDIAVLAVAEANADFHARKSARAKTYEYRILNRSSRSPLMAPYVWWLAHRLKLSAMREAAVEICGTHDFSAFRISGSNNINPVRRVDEACVRAGEDGCLIFRITANGFLRGMVRSLMGTLVQVGLGKAKGGLVGELLRSGERHRVGPTAPAQGLCLLEVFY